MKTKMLEKRIDSDEVIIEVFNFSIFNSLIPFILCICSIFLTSFMMSWTPDIVTKKEELIVFYGYAIEGMKYLSLFLIIIFCYSILKSLLGFVAFTNKRVILFTGILFTTFSELNYDAYSGNDLKRSLLSRILFYSKFDIYGYGMQVLEVPATHRYKAIRKQLHNIKNI